MSARRALYEKVRDALDPKTKKTIIRAINKFKSLTELPHHAEMRGRIFDMSKMQLVQIEGFQLHVMPNDYIGRSIIFSKTYESHVTQLIKKVLKRGDVFVDIGANVGYYTFLGAALVGKEGKVISFEPNPQNLHLIYSTALLYPDAKIEIYPYAASDSASILKFVTVGSNGGIIINAAATHDLLVQSVMLDKILKDEPRIDLIKIDIEGHESSGIRGMQELLAKHRPGIVTEFHPWAIENNSKDSAVSYLKQLNQLGYKLSIIETSGNIKPAANPEEIMSYWRALNSETINMDLYAQPL